ncbi:MAG: Ig-like domain-containing protein [Gammaproteobacteria bacterium]
MRKLLTAGVIAAGALAGPVVGSLGVSLLATTPANAATTTFDITGNLSKEYGSCTQITFSFSGSDCSWGRNRPAANATWIGPLFGGANYAIDGVKDQVTYIPTVADNVPQGTASSAANFIPAVDDGKFPAGITGQIVIDDKGTPGNLADDTVSGTMTIAAMARNVPTGQFTRAVQRWTSMDHVIPEIAVNAAETVANGNGGVDYVIGSRGFPTARCYRFDTNNCFPTSDMMPDFADARFWVQPPVGSKGIERTGLLGEPGFDEANPPSPSPPTGNVGAVSTGTINGGSCVTNNQAVDDCAASTLIWGAAEDPGFDNMVMKISTNGAGQITAAQVYWTQEFAISFGGPPAGFDNSFVAGTIDFTGEIVAPRARDFTVGVLQGSTGNVLDTLANSVNFGGPVTVTIVSGPTALGSATVSSTPPNTNKIIYDSIAGSGTDTIVYQATDGTATDDGTITINIAPDSQPVAPDGAITTISTVGATPGGSTTGTVVVSGLGGYSAGNAPSTITFTAPSPARGAVALTGATTIRYTPSATFFSGSDTFGYTITDSDLDTESGVITVTIADVNPTVADGSVTTDEGSPSSALPLAISPGNGAVSDHDITVTTNGANGNCTISGTSVTYTPDADFFGTDTCVVTITDGDASASDTGTISILVNEVDDSLVLPGGGSAVDPWSLALLGALPLLRRRRRRA